MEYKKSEIKAIKINHYTLSENEIELSEPTILIDNLMLNIPATILDEMKVLISKSNQYEEFCYCLNEDNDVYLTLTINQSDITFVFENFADGIFLKVENIDSTDLIMKPVNGYFRVQELEIKLSNLNEFNRITLQSKLDQLVEATFHQVNSTEYFPLFDKVNIDKLGIFLPILVTEKAIEKFPNLDFKYLQKYNRMI